MSKKPRAPFMDHFGNTIKLSVKNSSPFSGKQNRTTCNFQKHSSSGVLKKWCSENMQQIYWRPLMPKCDFNKVASQI